MAIKTPFRVTYVSKESLDCIAQFSEVRDALLFAKSKGNSEVACTVGPGKGLIAQYRKGKLTKEFEHAEWEAGIDV